jgi:transcriptional regulator with XRE-family HTH domain
MAEYRKKAGLSQRELAEEIGISRRMVAYYEGETSHPPAGIVPQLARVLGITPEELLGSPSSTSPVQRPPDSSLWRRFKQIEKLSPKERRQILQLIETLVAKEDTRDGTSG